jgi:hypothetical protein
MKTAVSRTLACLLSVGALVLVPASSASAHVVLWSSPNAVAAKNATFWISAAAESETSPIVKLVLTGPEGFDATGATFVNGPKGWTVAGAGNTLTVEGTGLPVKTDLQIAATVASLPSGTRNFFDIDQTYADGRVDTWIDDRAPGAEETETPSPILYLETAEQQASRTTKPESSSPSLEATSEESTSPVVWFGAGVATVVGVTALGLLAKVLGKRREGE